MLFVVLAEASVSDSLYIAMVCLLYLFFQIKRQHVLLSAALLKHGNSGPCLSVRSSAVLA